MKRLLILLLSALILSGAVCCFQLQYPDSSFPVVGLSAVLCRPDTTDSLVESCAGRELTACSDSRGADAVVCCSRARIHEANDEPGAALEWLVRAEKAAAAQGNDSLLGVVWESFGRLYSRQFHLPQAVDAFSRAVAFYDRCRAMGSKARCCNRLAEVHALQRRFGEAESMCCEALRIFDRVQDTAGLLQSYGMKAALFLRRTKNLAGTEKMLRNSYARYNGGQMPDADRSLWCLIFINKGRLDSARLLAQAVFCDAETRSERAAASFLLKDIEKRAGNFDLSVAYCEQYATGMDSIYTLEQSGAIRGLAAKYGSERLQEANRRLERHNFRLWMTGGGTILLLFCGSNALLRRRKRIIDRQQRVLKRYCGLVASLRNDYHGLRQRYEILLERSDRGDENEERFLAAFRFRLEGLKKLIDDAYLYERKPAAFFGVFKEFVTVNPNSRYAFSDLRYVVNKTSYGVIDYLEKHYPSLSSFDLDLCSILCFGFSPNGIRMLFSHQNIFSVYNKRSKLRMKLGLQSGEHIEAFLGELVCRLGEQADGVRA